MKSKKSIEDGSGTDTGGVGFLKVSNNDVAVAADNPSISAATCCRDISSGASRSLS